MILFHGSKTGGIKILEPHQADHDRPYIYLTTIDVVAAFYLCNAVQKPYYWFPYGFENGNMDIPVYNELYPDALREVSEGIPAIFIKQTLKKIRLYPLKTFPVHDWEPSPYLYLTVWKSMMHTPFLRNTKNRENLKYDAMRIKLKKNFSGTINLYSNILKKRKCTKLPNAPMLCLSKRNFRLYGKNI